MYGSIYKTLARMENCRLLIKTEQTANFILYSLYFTLNSLFLFLSLMLGNELLLDVVRNKLVGSELCGE